VLQALIIEEQISSEEMTVDSNARLQSVKPVSSAVPSYVRNAALRDWVLATAQLTRPDRILWCDGSQAEYQSLCRSLVQAGTLIPLNDNKRPGSFLARSDPADVARV